VFINKRKNSKLDYSKSRVVSLKGCVTIQLYRMRLLS